MNWLFDYLRKILGNRQTGRFVLRIGLPTRKDTKRMEITITTEQKVTVTLKPVTATGKPAKLDGTPSWTVTDGDSVVNPSPDGLSAELVSSDTPGTTTILLEADADLGEGIEPISEVIELTVTGAKASSFGLTVGEPEPK
jgi:hypothetical protein